jgi:hypothetical protein
MIVSLNLIRISGFFVDIQFDSLYQIRFLGLLILRMRRLYGLGPSVELYSRLSPTGPLIFRCTAFSLLRQGLVRSVPFLHTLAIELVWMFEASWDRIDVVYLSALSCYSGLLVSALPICLESSKLWPTFIRVGC